MGQRPERDRLQSTGEASAETISRQRRSVLSIGLNLDGNCPRCPARRLGAGVVERGALEKRCASNRTGGSNPSPTANFLNLLITSMLQH